MVGVAAVSDPKIADTKLPCPVAGVATTAEPFAFRSASVGQSPSPFTKGHNQPFSQVAFTGAVVAITGCGCIASAAVLCTVAGAAGVGAAGAAADCGAAGWVPLAAPLNEPTRPDFSSSSVRQSPGLRT